MGFACSENLNLLVHLDTRNYASDYSVNLGGLIKFYLVLFMWGFRLNYYLRYSLKIALPWWCFKEVRKSLGPNILQWGSYLVKLKEL